MVSRRAFNLKEKLARGEPSPGIWMNLPSPTVAEIIAGAGFDWVMFDSEHATFNPETLLHILMGFKGSDTVPLIRIPWNDQVMIKQVLDMGWAGILVPQVRTADEARRAVAACRYPPTGIRGWGPLRASNYYRDDEEYAKLANETVFCIIQIEDIAAVERIDEIVRVPGIDGIMVGRNDMSGTMGRLGDKDNPELWKAIHRIFDAVQATGIPTSDGSSGLERAEENLDMGCQFVFVGHDIDFLKNAADDSLRMYYRILKNRK